MPERQRRVGAYAKLLANYASDDAIIEAGEAAELLFVRGLAFLSTSDSDGFITDAQLTRFVGAGMRDAKKRAERLAQTGVWERQNGGYFVRSWLKIHPSAEEKGYRLKADRERKRAHPKPGFQQESERNPSGIQEQSDADSLSCTELSSKEETQQITASQDSAVHPPAPKRGTRLTDDWRPTEETRDWTLQRIDANTAAIELEKFRNHWISKTGKDATKLDWDRTWRNWVLNARPTNTAPGVGRATQKAQGWLALAQDPEGRPA